MSRHRPRKASARLFEHRVEHGCQFVGRGVDDLQHLGSRGLLFERLVTLCGSFIKLDPALGKLALKISYDLIGIGERAIGRRAFVDLIGDRYPDAIIL
jgi:hypothetical protein